LDEPLGNQWSVTFVMRSNLAHPFQKGDRVVWWADYDSRSSLSRGHDLSDRLVRESDLVPAEVAFLQDAAPSNETESGRSSKGRTER